MVSERQKTCKKIVRMEFFAVFLLWTIVQLNFPASPELTTQLQKLRLWLEQCAALNSINLFNQDTLCVISLKDKHQRMRKEIWLQKMTRKAVLFDQERGIMRVNRCLSLSLCFVKHLLLFTAIQIQLTQRRNLHPKLFSFDFCVIVFAFMSKFDEI